MVTVYDKNKQRFASSCRILSSSEWHQSTIEKEAFTAAESIEKWYHCLVGSTIIIITDLRSISLMFSQAPSGKIKNNEIQRWYQTSRSHFQHALVTVGRKRSRWCADSRLKVHNSSCQLRRHTLFVQKSNVFMEKLGSMILFFNARAEMNPTFLKPIYPTARLNVDFEGLLPSSSQKVLSHYCPWVFSISLSSLVFTSLPPLWLTAFLKSYWAKIKFNTQSHLMKTIKLILLLKNIRQIWHHCVQQKRT